MTGEVGGGERVSGWGESDSQVGDRLAGLIGRASQLDRGRLEKQGITVIVGAEEGSLGPELAYADPQEQALYYAQLLTPAVYMARIQWNEKKGVYDRVVIEVKTGVSGESVATYFPTHGTSAESSYTETGNEAASQANVLLGYFENAISKAEQSGKQGSGPLNASPFGRWLKSLRDRVRYSEANDSQQDARRDDYNSNNQ